MRGLAPQTLLPSTWDNYNSPQQNHHKKSCHIFQTGSNQAVSAPSASHILWMTYVAVFFWVNIPPLLCGAPLTLQTVIPLLWLLTGETVGPDPGSVFIMETDKSPLLLLVPSYKRSNNGDSTHYWIPLQEQSKYWSIFPGYLGVMLGVVRVWGKGIGGGQAGKM